MGCKIEFRCSEKERRKVKEKADKAGVSIGTYLLNATIHRRGRSGFNAQEKACVCRIKTCLNQIEEGLDCENNTKKIIEECKDLCQYLK